MHNGLLLLVLSQNGFGQTPLNDKNWDTSPIFADEFDNEQSFNNKWLKRWTWGPSNPTDLSYNHPNNVVLDLDSGILKGYAKHDPGYYEVWAWDSLGNFYTYYKYFEYTSNIIVSISAYSYGYYEIRCKLPYGEEFWPSFWNLSCSDSDPHYNEIDFFEKYPDLDDSTFTTNYHWLNTQGQRESIKQVHKLNEISPNSSGLSKQYYIFGVEWSPKWIYFYLNNKCIRIVANNANVPNHPQKIIAGFGVGRQPINHINFPAVMEIDYIKVYKLKMDCSNNAQILNNTNLLNFDYLVKNTILVGNMNSKITISNNASVTLRAVNSITINGEFTVSLGSEFCAMPTNCF
ncbi:MAG TPA: family 16 glycosylhydrolase [Tenuifilaceae bacterium]|nr:family 16 glycosylhydrolase [Tenuifilaceae bacterium]